MTSSLSLLEREMYSEAEAARLLGVPQATLHYWLDGKTGRGGKIHPPVIRSEPKGPPPPSRGRSSWRRAPSGSTAGT